MIPAKYKKLISIHFGFFYKPLKSLWGVFLIIPKSKDKIKLLFFKEKQIVKTSDDFLIVIDPNNGYVDKKIFINKNWESTLCKKIMSILKPNSVFIDVGGNIGYISLFAARNTPLGTVHYFEPIPKLHKQCEESISLNNFSNLKTHNIGCGVEKKTEQLHINKNNIGNSGMYTKGAEVIEIEIDTLDSLLKEEQQIDVIKIDVEGYELKTLQGMTRILQEQKPYVFIEYSPMLHKDKEDGVKILDLLFNLGYELEDIYLEKIYNNLDEIDHHYLNRVGQTDFLCTPQNKK